MSQTTNREGVQPHPLAETWIKVLLGLALLNRARSSFFPIASPSHQEFPQAFYTHPSEEEARTIIQQPPEQKAQSQKTK